MMPKVDTFEHDIVDEIKRKDASLTEISAASNNVGNEIVIPKKPPVFLIVLIVCFTVFLLALIGVMYYYYHDTLLPPSAKEIAITPNDIPKATTNLTNISPALASTIGSSVTKVEKKEKGYVLTISDYSSVFAYMTRNENDYILELALLFSQPEAASIQTQPTSTLPSTTTNTVNQLPQATTTTISATSTSTSSKQAPTKKITTQKSTNKTATSTKVTSSSSTQALTATTTTTEQLITPPVITGPHFSDITLQNQNMRVWTSGKRSLVYAFVGNTTVLISDTPEGILVLKGDILH